MDKDTDEEEIERSYRVPRVRQNIRIEEPEKRERIKRWMAVCILSTTLFIDLVQIILGLLGIGEILDTVINIGAAVLLWFWFKMLDVPYVESPKKLFTMLIQSGAELIPFVNLLPLLTIGTLIVIMLTHFEDKGGIIGKAAGAVGNSISRRGALKKAA